MGGLVAVTVNRTEGQRKLLVISHKHTQRAVARKCGVSQTVISQWISGARTPNYENRVALADKYGIDLDAWERPYHG
jgi:transcriptional regulator with XRE-family HTH domain